MRYPFCCHFKDCWTDWRLCFGRKRPLVFKRLCCLRSTLFSNYIFALVNVCSCVLLHDELRMRYVTFVLSSCSLLPLVCYIDTLPVLVSF